MFAECANAGARGRFGFLARIIFLSLNYLIGARACARRAHQ